MTYPTEATTPSAVRPGNPTGRPPASGGGHSLPPLVGGLWKSAPSISSLLPLKAWWEGKAWSRGAPLLFLLFAVAPFIILHSVGESGDIETVAWSFSLYFAVLWALAMWALIRPGKPNLTLLAKIGVASALAGIPLAIWLEQQLMGGSSLASYIYGVGVPEEIAKAAPVFVLMYVFAEGRKYTPRMFMYMGAVSGLAFGAMEAVKYSNGYVQNLLQGQQPVSSFSTELFWRLLCDSLFHACAAAISCYFIGLAVRHPRWRVQLISFGLGLVAVLHGMFDRYSSGYFQVAITALLLFIFIGYVISADEIESEVRRADRRVQHQEAGSATRDLLRRS
jgi:RsiW-degrading membrane proteinase PrsW (M82 family)